MRRMTPFPSDLRERLRVDLLAPDNRLAELEADNALLRLSLAQSESAGEQQDIVANELKHRIANLLAVVQSMARHTFRNADADSLNDFAGRLAALAAAQTLLIDGDKIASGLPQIVRFALAPHSFDDRCTIAGPDLQVSGHRAHALTLALHELATNAAKYGALSVDNGYVEVKWATVGGALDFVWREHDGPPVEKPERRGFGSLLILKNLAAAFSGVVDLSFDPSGVVCRLKAPLTRDGAAT